MGNITKENWKDTDLNVDSLWLFGERSKSGKHSNIYHGNFIPQIPNQLIRRYTDENDTVLELFAGSGTTLFECEVLLRNYIGFDINTVIIDYIKSKMTEDSKINYSICNCDVTNCDEFNSSMVSALEKHNISMVDFMMAHPPYLDIVKFTQDNRDLSNITEVEPFLLKFRQAVSNGFRYLKKGKYFALVAGDIYRNREVVPLAFYMMNEVKRNFNVKLKGIIVKNIEGNRGKLGHQDIWKYRALQSDYFLFKHEYIFVFKKMI